MPRITRESLLSLEAYSRGRAEFRSRVIAHKKARAVHLGFFVTGEEQDDVAVGLEPGLLELGERKRRGDDARPCRCRQRRRPSRRRS